jgi:hypothetical protein
MEELLDRYEMELNKTIRMESKELENGFDRRSTKLAR